MVGHTPIAMYVAFQGTKQARDWAANLSFPHVTMGHATGDGAKVRGSAVLGDPSARLGPHWPRFPATHLVEPGGGRFGNCAGPWG